MKTIEKLLLRNKMVAQMVFFIRISVSQRKLQFILEEEKETMLDILQYTAIFF